MPSGKQILLNKLLEVSTERIDNTEEATDTIRAALLLHGSHSPDNIDCANQFSYLESGDAEYTERGPAFTKSQVFISDLLFELSSIDQLPDDIKSKFPNLTLDDFKTTLHLVSLIFSALHWDTHYDSIEKDYDEKKVDKMLKWSQLQFEDMLND